MNIVKACGCVLYASMYIVSRINIKWLVGFLIPARPVRLRIRRHGKQNLECRSVQLRNSNLALDILAIDRDISPLQPLLVHDIYPLVKMAAAIKALNAKIRSNKYTDYLFSTRKRNHRS